MAYEIAAQSSHFCTYPKRPVAGDRLRTVADEILCRRSSLSHPWRSGLILRATLQRSVSVASSGFPGHPTDDDAAIQIACADRALARRGRPDDLSETGERRLRPAS